MSRQVNNNGRGMEDDPPEQQVNGEQATALQQLRHLQSDIEEQCRQIAMAINPLSEALCNGGGVSPEMMGHVKAQLLKAHLQLDDLEQLLDTEPYRRAGETPGTCS